MKKVIKNLIIGTLYSILVFFSISFVTVILHINSPLHRYAESYKFEIGFPFEYYYQFCTDIVPNSGWNLANLIYNCLLTWFFVCGIYIFVGKLTKNGNQKH
jgi:hypothetical protein